MKKHCLLPLVMLLVTLAAAVRAQADQITVGGTSRTYIKYVPDELGENRPLLISMHGMNQDANYQKGMLQIESIADTAKFAVVFPEGLNRSWDISGTSDINFVLAVIDDMAKKHAIDKKRVYLSGFSMGGMFTYHAMNHIADKIAAFAPISGYPMGGQPFTSSRPVPIIHTHGTGDDVVDFGGVQRSLDGWIERNGCYPKAVVTYSYRTYIATKHQWGPGDDGAEVVLLELADKGHWISNDGFYTGEEIWNFCKRYSLDENLPKVSVKYPLCEGEFITVASGSDYNVFFEAEATSEVSEIESVAFYCDGEFVGIAEEAPYICRWENVKKGKRMLKVVATDRDGRTSARAIPFSIRVAFKNVDMAADFNDDGVIPAGWVTCDGNVVRVGPKSNLIGGNRVLKFTGSPRDFDYAMLVNNVKGEDDGAYAAFGDLRGSKAIYLTPGTYELSFKTCNWSAPDFGDIYCRVLDAFTDEVLAESAAPVTLGLDKSKTDPFTGATEVTMTFGLYENTMTKFVFYAPNQKKGDALFADTILKKVSTEGISDIESGDAQVTKVTYFDLLGREHSAPIKGIQLRRTDFSDGTTVTEKIICK